MTAKKFLPIIIVLLLTLTLASCAGIGDGALMGNSSLGTEEKTEKIVVADETLRITLEEFLESLKDLDEKVPFSNAETKCTFSMYGFTGDEKANLNFEGVEAYNLFRMVYYSQRERITESPDRNHNYIDIDFYYDTAGDITRQGKFRIYSNDYVDVTEQGISTMVSSTVLNGYVEGIYQDVISYASTVIKPNSATMRVVMSPLSASISPESDEVELDAADAEELYKLLMSGETVTVEESAKIPFSSGYTIVSFTADCGIAQFHVGVHDQIEQTHGFLEGNALFYSRYSEGICQKLLSYFN